MLLPSHKEQNTSRKQSWNEDSCTLYIQHFRYCESKMKKTETCGIPLHCMSQLCVYMSRVWLSWLQELRVMCWSRECLSYSHKLWLRCTCCALVSCLWESNASGLRINHPHMSAGITRHRRTEKSGIEQFNFTSILVLSYINTIISLTHRLQSIFTCSIYFPLSLFSFFQTRVIRVT